jgi:hypothetical protein
MVQQEAQMSARQPSLMTPYLKERVDRAIHILEQQGHQVEVQVHERMDGTTRFMYDIDRHLLVFGEDLAGIADGETTFQQLEEQHRLHPE